MSRPRSPESLDRRVRDGRFHGNGSSRKMPVLTKRGGGGYLSGDGRFAVLPIVGGFGIYEVTDGVPATKATVEKRSFEDVREWIKTAMGRGA